MTGKEFYKSTWDEVQISDAMLAKLMLQGDGGIAYQTHHLLEHRILKAAVGFLGFLLASGTLFSVPLL